MMLLFLFFLHMLHASDAPSLSDTAARSVEHAIGQKMSLQQQEIELFVAKLNGFPDEIKKKFGSALLNRWSQEKILFSPQTHLDISDSEEIDELIIDSSQHCLLVRNTVFALHNEMYVKQLSNYHYCNYGSTKAFAANGRFVLGGGSFNSYFVLHDLETHKTDMVQTHNYSSYEYTRPHVRFIIPHASQSNALYVISSAFGKSGYQLVTEKSITSERLFIPYVNGNQFEFWHGKAIDYGDYFVLGNLDGCVLCSKNPESKDHVLPYIVFHLVAGENNRYCVIQGLDKTEQHPRSNHIFILKELNQSDIKKIKVGRTYAMSFLPKMESGHYVACIMQDKIPNNRNEELRNCMVIYDIDQCALITTIELPYQIKNMWHYKNMLMLHTTDHKVIGYPSWFLESMIKLAN